ncbi:MAG: hypothetical protein LC796_03390 [Acidobacteria bacterium]|nr:hypothetical protein [Acidobacteriota bacterium]
MTGNGTLQVNTGTSVIGTVSANTTVVVVGWAPVVNSMSAGFGNIAAYVNCNLCTFATIGLLQSPNAYVGQFTAQAGPPIIVYPAFQSNSPMNLNNNSGSTGSITWGCQAGNVTGACLFNIRTFPAADPNF